MLFSESDDMVIRPFGRQWPLPEFKATFTTVSVLVAEVPIEDIRYGRSKDDGTSFSLYEDRP